MRIGILMMILAFPLTAASQRGNDRPEIVGQSDVSTNEDQSVTIQLTDLRVRDRDDWWYPWGFSLTVHEGKNYRRENHTVIPDEDFNGTLSVPVTVNDGEHDSKKFDLQVTVLPINDLPMIVSQATLSTPEEQPVQIALTHLTIDDPDDAQFTMTVSDGEHYSVSGATITPETDFNGTLSIPISVHDGEAGSNTYDFKLQVSPVNDKPKITAQQALQTVENKSITIETGHLTVTDPDNVYPADFKVVITPATNNTYSVSGTQVTPALNFEGVLTVPLSVNDGEANSDPFDLKITVLPGNNAPVIVGQSPAEIQEDESFTIEFAQLQVTDTDNTYPNGFSIKILDGQNYSGKDKTITPAPDYSGTLNVNIKVNDGHSDSDLFLLKITVNEVNDAPRLVNIETTPLEYEPTEEGIVVTSDVEVRDPDNNNLTQAEVFIDPKDYRPGSDELEANDASNTVEVAFDPSRGILTVSGVAPIGEYESVIRSVLYTHRVGAFETKKILMRVNDGIEWSETAERTLTGPDYVVALDIPTAFTPNGDNANDTWSIKPIKQSEELDHAVVRVYNKSGYLLFETTGFEREWDGRAGGVALPPDTYFYTIDFNVDYLRKTFKGIVTILR